MNDVERSIIQMNSIAPTTVDKFRYCLKQWELRRRVMRMLIDNKKAYAKPTEEELDNVDNPFKL